MGRSRSAAEPGRPGHRLLHTHFVRLRQRRDLRTSDPDRAQRFHPYPLSNLFSRSCAVFSEW